MNCLSDQEKLRRFPLFVPGVSAEMNKNNYLLRTLRLCGEYSLGGKMIKIGLIGYGYWGPNLARNFNVNPDFDLTPICDFSPKRLELPAAFTPRPHYTTT